MVSGLLCVSYALRATPAHAQLERGSGEFYVGFELGYHDISTDVVLEALDIASELGESGAIFSGLGGYRYAFDNGLVLGGEAFFGESTVEGDASSLGLGDVVTEADRHLGVDFNIGYLLDRSLVFGKVGYADVKSTPRDLTGATISVPGLPETSDALRLGAGFEYRFNRILAARGTVLFTNDEDILVVDPFGSGFDIELGRSDYALSVTALVSIGTWPTPE